MYKEAVEEWEEAMTGFGYDDLAEGLRRGYAADGFQGAVRQWAAGWERATNGEGFPLEHLAYLCILLGEKDRAFTLLEKAIEVHSSGSAYLKVDPTFDDIRSDPRFADLLHRVGLSP